VSSRVFRALDNYLWRLTYKWACWSHSSKPKGWIAGRYFRKFEKFRNDRWVFGDKDTGAYLPRLAWTDIVRHTLVKGGASPDDPALAGYLAQRRQKVKPPLDSYTVRLAAQRRGLLVDSLDGRGRGPSGQVRLRLEGLAWSTCPVSLCRYTTR
jgi:RNA-directed DNA polymerase